MAEYVNRRMEDKIPYLELLKLTELYKPQEISELVQKISDHEYKIQRRERCLEDILKYVQFQVNLLEEIHGRREKVNYFHKTDQIEGVIRSQINSLFGVAALKFHDRLDFWSARINFAKSQKWPSAVRKHFEQVTKLMGKKYPQLWIEASKYEWSLNPPKNIDAARKILQLGLRDNPDSEALFISAFRLEVEYVNTLERRPTFLDQVLSEDSGELIVNKLALAKVIYNAAKKHAKKSDQFYLKFFLALNDATPAKSQQLSEEIKADAEADLSVKQANSSKKPQEPSIIEVEENVRTQFQNFQLFFSNLSEVKKALTSAQLVEDTSFWKKLFHILTLKNIPIKVNDWFQLCMIPKKSDVITELRLWVLNYYSLEYSSGLSKARKWYEKIHNIYPTSPQTHLAMVDVEMKDATPDFQRIQQYFDRVILLHGKDSMEPWLAYLRFEKRYRPRENNHSVIHARALSELSPHLQESFRIALLKDSQTQN